MTDLLYHRSGLLGVSGLSSDMRELLASDAPSAVEAIDLFVYRIGRELGSLVAALGGLDVLVFLSFNGHLSFILLPPPTLWHTASVFQMRHRNGLPPRKSITVAVRHDIPHRPR